MKIRIQDIRQSSFCGRTLTVATLNVPYFAFIDYLSRLARPVVGPGQRVQFRVELRRPDGTRIVSDASIPLVNGNDPPARLNLEGLSPAEAPPGTEVPAMRYETVDDQG